MLLNDLCISPAGASNANTDVCLPISTGVDDTHATLNLMIASTQQNAGWPVNWPTTGAYAIYGSAHPSAVDTVHHTFTAVGSRGVVTGSGSTAPLSYCIAPALSVVRSFNAHISHTENADSK
jgi:hypothetical protein